MKNKVGTVFIDFDGVITNSAKRIIQMLNEKFNKNNDENSHNFYNLCDVFPETTRDDLDDCFTSKEFFDENLLIFDDFCEIIEKNKEKFDFSIVTHGLPKNLENKKNWCQYNLPSYIDYIGVPMGQDKSVVNMEKMIMIDDNIDVLLKTNAKIKILFVSNGFKNYNTVKPNDNVYVAYGWKDIGEILTFYGRINKIF